MAPSKILTSGCPELPIEPQAIGTPLGILADAAFGTGEATLANGDRIVLYTDGLYEMINPSGEVFGPERLKISLSRHRNRPGADLLQAMLKDIRRYAGDAVFSDDICAVIVAYMAENTLSPAYKAVHQT